MRIKRLLITLFLASTLILSACAPKPQTPPSSQNLTVHFIDVGQGDAILIDLGTTEILIDGGEKNTGAADYIRPYVDGPIEVMVATHTHTDHIGGLIAVLKEFPVKEVWIDGQTQTTKTYEDFLDAIDKSGAAFHEARRGGEIRLAGLVFRILHPRQPFLEEINNNSVVLKMAYGQVSFLFPGDAESEAEKRIMAYNGDLKSTVLKLGHHGSRTASSEAFLKAVQPQVAVYMAGLGNSYGHPHRETISKLNKLKVKIYGTDVNGTVIIRSDGSTYAVATEKGTP